MKRLVICFDGTWNTAEQEDNGIPAPTNVYKLFNALADNSAGNTSVEKYYHPGVGSEGGAMEKLLGGALGKGIGHHICSAYHWLAERYTEGDEIYLFGFSRGAFTVRSLAGMLGMGLVNLTDVDHQEGWDIVHALFAKGYRRRRKDNKARVFEGTYVKKAWQFFHTSRAGKPRAVPVRFIGVWDTVGALGIPDDLELLNLFDDKSDWEFHDVRLGAHVQSARHAVALDEVRSSFTATLWETTPSQQDVKQVWFPGVHADVGGGYANTALSDIALKWMIDEAAATGLEFRAAAMPQIRPDALGVMHNSYKGMFGKFRSRPRNIPALVADNNEFVHASVFERQQASPINYPPYRRTTRLGPGESITVNVFARDHWNETTLYLDRDERYRFSAVGNWQDKKDTCDWRGTEDDKFSFGDVVRSLSTLAGKLETENMDIYCTKRVEDFPWFALVGALCNDRGHRGNRRGVAHDGSPVPHEYLHLPDYADKDLKISVPGYFYCFANDAWGFYDNNRGSVLLTIERVA